MEERVDIPELEQLNNLDVNFSKEDFEKLEAQNKELMNLIKSLDAERYFKRMDYLFEVVKNAKEFDVPFVERVVAEIEMALYQEPTTKKEE